MNQETVNNRAKLMMHRIIARRIAEDPALIESVRSQCQPTATSPDFVAEWCELLELDPGDLRRMLTQRSEKMTRLRNCSPLAFVVDFRDPALRRRIWRLAKKGLDELPPEIGH